MKYLNIDTALFEIPDFLRASHQQIGIWMRLYAYCGKQENMGIIKECQNWEDEIWQRLFGCSKTQLESDSPLWFFRNNALMVNHYNIKQEEFYHQKRKAAALGGINKSPLKRAASKRNGKQGGRPKIIQITEANGITQA